MKKTAKKLNLSRETLHYLDVFGGKATIVGDPSCKQSCYIVSCGDTTCTASTCEKTA
ncbi:MAG TPA: hypothetical protein VF173_36915 [Thermoanaerobaculia bacterium]|nr:hypothetical protein [Thermoanaerobaculia bacterium]